MISSNSHNVLDDIFNFNNNSRVVDNNEVLILVVKIDPLPSDVSKLCFSHFILCLLLFSSSDFLTLLSLATKS